MQQTSATAYDADGEVASTSDALGNATSYTYDLLGRQTMDTVATFAPFVNHTVRALGTTYDTLGHVILATSYGWGSPPAVVNQVENVYDGLGNLVTQYQSLSGPVNTTTSPYTPAVQYQYTTCYAGAGNYSRLTGITYPGGTQVSYAYAGLNDLDDAISRITSVSDGGQMVESYRYLGLSTVIGATLPEPSINETVSLDNFGNVADIAWTQGGTLSGNTVSGGTPLVNVAYGYNSVGEVTWRQDVQAAAAGVTDLDQTYSYDSAERLTGYQQGAGTLSGNTMTIASPTVTASWSLDSEGNRYNASGTYGTSYGANDESLGTSTQYAPRSGNTTTVSFGASGSVTVHYDAWGRVVETYSGSSSVAGPNGAASYTTYSYNALGRQITTNNYTNTDTLISGTQTYFDGANPIEVRMQDNTLLATNVWSPADGRLILRDAVATVLSTYTGLTITPNSAGGIQRLYPMTDGIGSIVAVADPTGTVQERYTYTADGLPQALTAAWAARSTGWGIVQYASTLGWNWLYRGQQWVQTQPDTSSAQWRGLYVGGSGQWYDPVHATTLQPNLSGYGDPQTNPYQMTFQEQFGATVAPMAIGIGVGIIAGIATGGLGLAFMPGIMAGAAGGAASMGSSTYAAGGDFGQIAESAAIGAVAGAAGGAAGGFAGDVMRGALSAVGISCCRRRYGARRAPRRLRLAHRKAVPSARRKDLRGLP